MNNKKFKILKKIYKKKKPFKNLKGKKKKNLDAQEESKEEAIFLGVMDCCHSTRIPQVPTNFFNNDYNYIIDIFFYNIIPAIMMIS